MSLTAALIAGGASLLGGALSNRSNAKQAKSQQEFQADQVRDQMAYQDESIAKQMDFQREQNQKAMDFSEYMSSTAHQREILDLKAAGLNPILSGTGGAGAHSAQGVTSAGASSSGSVAPGSKAEIRDVVSPAVSSALQAGQLASVMADLDVKKAHTANILAQTQTELNRPENIAADTALSRLRGKTEEWGPEVQKWRAEESSSRFGLNIAQKEAIKTYQQDLSRAQAQAAISQARLTSSSAKSADVKARLDNLYGEAERIIGMGEGATSAVRNVLPALNLRHK